MFAETGEVVLADAGLKRFRAYSAAFKSKLWTIFPTTKVV
jgi:hypothetical protein